MRTRGRVWLACAALLWGFDWPGEAARQVARLEEASAEERQQIVRRLALGPADEVHDAILHALDDPEPDVRGSAAAAAARLSLSDAAPRLVRGLGSNHPGFRAACAKALGRLGDDAAVPALMRALKDSELRVRVAAIEALAALGDPRAVAGLVEALDDSGASARVQAVEALSRFGDPTTTASLVGLAKDPAAEVRAAVMRTLAELGDPRALTTFVRALDDDAPEVALRAAHGIGQTRAPEAFDTLTTLLDGRDVRMARAALAALTSLGTEQAVARIVESAAQPDLRDMALAGFVEALRRAPSLRAAAARQWVVALATARDPAHEGTLLQMAQRTHLAQSAPNLRNALLSEYEGARDVRTQIRYLPVLAELDDARVRWRLLERTELAAEAEHAPLLSALERSLPPGMGLSADPLLHWLPRIDPSLRPRLVDLVARSGAARAANALAAQLSSPDPRVREATLRAFARLGHAPSLQQVRASLRDSDAAVARQAGRTLGALSPKGTLDSLLEQLDALHRKAPDADQEPLLWALATLLQRIEQVEGKSRQQALEEVLRRAFFDSRSARAAAVAVDTVEAWGSARAYRVLDLSGAGSSWRRRIAALHALGRRDSEAARATLLPVARGDDATLAAVALLALAPHTRAEDVEWLKQEAENGSWPVRPNAAFVLNQLASRLPAEALPPRTLCRLARDPDPHVSANGFAALARRAPFVCATATARWSLARRPDVRQRAVRRWAQAQLDSEQLDPQVRQRLQTMLGTAQAANDVSPPHRAPFRTWTAVQKSDGSVLVTHPDPLGRLVQGADEALAVEAPWYAPFSTQRR